MAFEDTHGSPLVLSFQTFAVLVGLSLAKPLFGPRPNLSLAQGMRGEDLDDVLTFFPTGGSAPSTRAQHVGHDSDNDAGWLADVLQHDEDRAADDNPFEVSDEENDDPGAPLLEHSLGQSFFEWHPGNMREPIQHALLCAKMREAKARKNLHMRSMEQAKAI